MFTGIAIVAAALAVTFVGATLPTPLYPLYRHAFGFGTVTLALIYASYVLGNLLALLVFGRVSDQVGRRRVILPAIACAFVSTLAFAFATNPAWLFVARSLSGLGTGVVSGAATAWIAEIFGASRKRTATSWAVAANFLGLAAGPLLAAGSHKQDLGHCGWPISSICRYWGSLRCCFTPRRRRSQSRCGTFATCHCGPGSEYRPEYAHASYLPP